MSRTITVKGIGRASAKPDTVVIFMLLDSRTMDYDKAMEIAADNIQDIVNTLVDADFDKEDIKSTNFNVGTNYGSVKDRNGDYHQEFRGYVVSHNLKLEFALDVMRLSLALSAIAGCKSHPQLSISFVVKDTAAVNEEMLRSATANARKKAEILCNASGVTLGRLLTIDYNWGELNICSNTRYSLAEECLATPTMARSIDIEPEDIDVSDTATFVWEID